MDVGVDLHLTLFVKQSLLLTTLKKRAFENIVGKGENAGYQHFLLFPQFFLLYQRMMVTSISPFPTIFSALSERQKLSFQQTFILSSANAFNLVLFKILPFGRVLIKLKLEGDLTSTEM